MTDLKPGIGLSRRYRTILRPRGLAGTHGKSVWRALLRRLPAALGILLSAALLAAARLYQPFAEWYATRIYPVFVRTVGGLSGLVPFSVGEALIGAAAAAVIFWIVLLLPRKGGNAQRRRILCGGCAALWWVLSVVLLLYALFCGVNYHRLPFSYYSGLAVRPSSAQELAALAAELVCDVNRLSAELPNGEDGVTQRTLSPREASLAAVDAMRRLGAQHPSLDGYYPPAKPVLFSRGMSYLQITGVYFPPAVEANFNQDVLPYVIPSTICHELSHLRGFMREDEANFIAYIACRGSGRPDFEYSGAMLALSHALSALYDADADLYFAADRLLCSRAQADFSANNAYWRQFEGPVGEVSNAVNDVYLKANAQADGVKSYGRMVDLLLADYRQRHGL